MLSNAEVSGVHLRSQCVTFIPSLSLHLPLQPSSFPMPPLPSSPSPIDHLQPITLTQSLQANLLQDKYLFNIGSAGSCSLVLQTILPIILYFQQQQQQEQQITTHPITIDIIGGTHNPLAPPFEYLQYVYLPQLHKMGIEVSLRLLHYGFFPRGGGHIQCIIYPWIKKKSLQLVETGALIRRSIISYSLNTSKVIIEAALSKLSSNRNKTKSKSEQNSIEIVDLSEDGGVDDGIHKHDDSGNNRSKTGKRCRDGAAAVGHYILERVDYEHVSDIITTIIDKSTLSLCDVQINDGMYAVGEYLSDQLLLPMVIGGVPGGHYTILEPSLHFTTNMSIIQLFYPNVIRVVEHDVYVH